MYKGHPILKSNEYVKGNTKNHWITLWKEKKLYV